MKRFVTWSAVSSIPQLDGYSLDEQRKEGRHHVEKWGGTLVAELVVDGDSRNIVEFSEARRLIPEYQRLYEFVKAKAFDVLAFRNRGRLGRDAALSMTVVAFCRQHGIVAYDMERPPHSIEFRDWDVGDEVVGAIRSVTFQDEVKQFAANNQKGMRRRVEDGFFPGKVPWGWVGHYEIVEGRRKAQQVAEVDPLAQRTLRQFLDGYLVRGVGLRAAALELNELGYPAPGGLWSKRKLQRILDNILRYAGIVEINKHSTKRAYVRAASRWPALLTMEEAEAVIAERTRRNKARRSVSSIHRFSQCVFCENHDTPRSMAAYTATSYDRNKPPKAYRFEVYRCNHPESNRQWHAGGYVTAKLVHEAIEAAILAVHDDEYRTTILAKMPDRTPVVRQEISEIEQLITMRQKAIQDADDAHYDGLLDLARWRRQIDRLNDAIGKMQKRLSDLSLHLAQIEQDNARPQRIIEVADQGLAMLTDADVQRSNAWLRRHVRVYVRDNRVTAVDFI